MGRELKRVPLDFSWPLEKPWEGYVRICPDPECEGCEDCMRRHPPAGEGYQIWETVSEGSPISPVFATPEELAQHMATKRPWGGKASYEAWLKFINGPGWAPSGMIVNGTFYDGVDGVTRET